MSRVLVTLLACVAFAAPISGEVVVGARRGRPVRIYVPPTYDPAIPAPLVISLHGYSRFESPVFTGLEELALSEGFLYARPNGTLNNCNYRFWNATDACCGKACGKTGLAVDDAGYLHDVVQETRILLNVDEERIYFVGYSNGGFMAHRMACEYPELIAAVVSHAGAVYDDPDNCSPNAPVHVLEVHAIQDANIPFEGGSSGGTPFPGAVETVETWALLNDCTLVLEEGPPLNLVNGLSGDETTVTRYVQNCREGGSAELWAVDGADHYTLVAEEAFTRELIRYLLNHPKPPGPRPRFAGTPLEGTAPLEVILDATETTSPPDTEITDYLWDFGDSSTATGAIVNHTYTGIGRLLATLTVQATGAERTWSYSRLITVLEEVGDLGPWSLAQVGDPRYTGSARFEGGGADGSLRLVAGGRDLGGLRDGLAFVLRELAGDVAITAHFAEFAPGEPGAKAGVMFRRDLDASSPFVAVMIEQSPAVAEMFRVRFHHRRSSGFQGGSPAGITIDLPTAWLRLERRGDVFTGLSSVDGTVWTTIYEEEIAGLPAAILAGVAGVGGDVEGAHSFDPLVVGISKIVVAHPDACDLDSGVYHDCDSNGLADECEIAKGSVSDCDGNGIPDSCDLVTGLLEDCDSNGIADICEAERFGTAIANDSGLDDAAFLGAPDWSVLGLGGQAVTFDLGDVRVVDGEGGDLTIYEWEFEDVPGGVEFEAIDVLVSEAGSTYVSIKSSEGAAIRVPGDELFGDTGYARCYDLAAAGLESARFIRVDGAGDEPAGLDVGFDLDALGLVHFSACLGGSGAQFIRGDCDGDGNTGGVKDALTMLTVNFIGGVTAPCQAACDTDGNGVTTGVNDALMLLRNNFIGGVEIPPPFPECGPEVLPPTGTDEPLGCDTPPERCRS